MTKQGNEIKRLAFKYFDFRTVNWNYRNFVSDSNSVVLLFSFCTGKKSILPWIDSFLILLGVLPLFEQRWNDVYLGN